MSVITQSMKNKRAFDKEARRLLKLAVMITARADAENGKRTRRRFEYLDLRILREHIKIDDVQKEGELIGFSLFDLLRLYKKMSGGGNELKNIYEDAFASKTSSIDSCNFFDGIVETTANVNVSTINALYKSITNESTEKESKLVQP